MEIKFTKDELAILKWIYDRAGGFDVKHELWANPAKKELSLSDERYERAVSFLRQLNLVITREGHIDRPKPEDGEYILMTGQGVNAYRNAVDKKVALLQSVWVTFGRFFRFRAACRSAL
jgi:hypothetical protein